MTALIVESAGFLCTVQDLGRPGHAHIGVPLSGAMDRFAIQAANLLVGNDPGDAGLEITGGGAEFVFGEMAEIALTGGDLGARLNGVPVPPWRSALASAGSVLRLTGRVGTGAETWGGRSYLAFSGGIDVEPVLGSRSTYVNGGFGGLDGRALRGGDVLARARSGAPRDPVRWAGMGWPASHRPGYGPTPVARVMPGPHIDHFAPHAAAAFVDAEYVVGGTSNRMGYRLAGAPLRHADDISLPSLGVFPGVVQVPPDAQPICLMADAQTTGGYPIFATVIQADLPLLAQLLPGDRVRFRWCDEATAVAASRQQQSWLAQSSNEDDASFAAAGAGWPGADATTIPAAPPAA